MKVRRPLEHKRLVPWIMFLLVVLVLLVPQNARSEHAYVLKVMDGDSIRVKKGGKIFDVRLYGIDAPEYGQPFGKRARNFTRSRLLRRTVTLEQRDVDRYGRVVAVVRCWGRSVSRELVKNGLAWVYPRYCVDKSLCSVLTKDQERARKARRGLWKDKTPVPPWEWKAKKRY